MCSFVHSAAYNNAIDIIGTHTHTHTGLKTKHCVFVSGGLNLVSSLILYATSAQIPRMLSGGLFQLSVPH